MWLDLIVTWVRYEVAQVEDVGYDAVVRFTCIKWTTAL